MKTTYPTLKGVAYVIRYPKGHKPGEDYTRENIGSMLLPNSYFADQCEGAVSRKFREANAFRVYGNDGTVFFCGSL
jgi:hypothetical protein